jgi:hypothetical protein
MGLWIQAALGLAIVILLLAIYWRFRTDLLRYLLDHLGQSIILVLLYLIVYAQLGGELGIPYLFWNEEPLTRFSAAVGCTLLLALIGTNAYYLIPEDQQPQVMNRTKEFLDTRSILKLPFGGWLEPRTGNPLELSRFLRTVRLPFLMLLLLPAMLPLVFASVPRYSPVYSDFLRKLLNTLGLPDFYRWLNSSPDVSAHPTAYAIGILVWASGLVFGVVLVKLAIKATHWLNPLVTKVDAIVFPRVRLVLAWLTKPLGGPTTRPSTTKISDDKVNSIMTFFVLTLLCYAALSTVLYRWIPPSFAICSLLGILAMASVAIELLRPRFRLLIVSLVIFWIALVNHDPFKLRFDYLPYYPDKGVPVILTEQSVLGLYEASKPSSGALLDESPLLCRWAEFAQAKSKDPGTKPKLAVICVSGGAIRSAYWSAVVLDKLEKRIQPANSFHNHVRVITGASGGMVGTAYYVKWLYDNLQNASNKSSDSSSAQDPWYSIIPKDSLRKVARSLALHETWRMLVPRRGEEEFGDRGKVLEKDWKDLCQISFSHLWSLEKEGKLPSLIFSPMTVDDGRRLLISNLDLRSDPGTQGGAEPLALPLNRGGALIGGQSVTATVPYSLSGIEFFKIFPDANGFLVSTAARMNATFPWVSPAVNLPTDPPLRVVDAGYYDNYGVNVAGAWLRMHQPWLIENTSGVVLIQIRDSVSRNDRLGFPEPESYGTMKKALSGLQFLFTPIDAVLAARSTSAIYRNDQAVSAIGESFMRQTNDPAFFTTVDFENSAEVTVDEEKDNDPNDWDKAWTKLMNPEETANEPSSSTTVAMSWYLTEAEIRALNNAIPSFTGRPDFKGPPEFAKRETAIKNLADQVANAPFGAERDRLRRKLDRARKFDERARNAERLEAIASWWDKDHTVKEKGKKLGQGQ